MESEMTQSPDVLIDVVDAQKGFMKPGCDLYFPGADSIIPAFNQFLATLTPQHARAVLFKYDTHFLREYPFSPEAQIFPKPHCVYGTEGQTLAVETGDLASRLPVAHMNKNEFSMWGENPTARRRIVFDSADERAVYRNLFCVTDSFNQTAPGIALEAWRVQNNISPQTGVVVVGVASDYCVKQAMAGYLDRGQRVTVLTDLVAGIGGEFSDVRSGHINDVAAQLFGSALQTGQLKLMTSQHWLARRP
jgi:nicotinamidase/pyrazinamidase